jgi:hypothetical protein
MCTLIAEVRMLDLADGGQPLHSNVPVTEPVREKPGAGLAEIQPVNNEGHGVGPRSIDLWARLSRAELP